MSTTAVPMTVEEFLALPGDNNVRRELIGGEVLTMGRGGQPHEVVKSNFIHELAVYFKYSPIGRVMSETMFRLSPNDSLMPDVSVVLAGRLKRGQTGLIGINPDLAVEVVSSETAADLQGKIELYLEHDVRAVWVAYPELRLVFVHTPAAVRQLSGGQTLEQQDLLPGFSAPVSAFFEGL